MIPQIIACVALVVYGFMCGYGLSSWLYQSKEAEHAQQKLAAVRLSAAADIRRLDNTIAAQGMAVVRERGIRRDVDALRGHIVRMSDAESTALRAAGASHQACLVTAATFRELFDAELEASRGLSEACDRHVSDIRTLTDAWPQ